MTGLWILFSWAHTFKLAVLYHSPWSIIDHWPVVSTPVTKNNKSETWLLFLVYSLFYRCGSTQSKKKERLARQQESQAFCERSLLEFSRGFPQSLFIFPWVLVFFVRGSLSGVITCGGFITRILWHVKFVSNGPAHKKMTFPLCFFLFLKVLLISEGATTSTLKLSLLLAFAIHIPAY